METADDCGGRYRRWNESVDRVPLYSLFLAFLRLGLTAFGGPAMVAYIGDVAVRKRRWLAEETFAYGTALCQSIPGATAMQTAAFVGLRVRGIAGALAAYAGFGLPAFVLMVVLSGGYAVSRDLRPVAAAFRGLHVIVVALIANALATFGRRSIKGWRDAILAGGAATFLMFQGSPIVSIVVSAAVGSLLYRGANLPVTPVYAAGQPSGRRIMRLVLPTVLAGSAALAALLLTNRPLFDLATVMAKVDLFAFGGGFASVPVMLHEVVDVRNWMDNRTFMDGIALGQVTPGPIVITATFVGYQLAGLLGAVVGTVAIFSPSFLALLVIVPHFDRLQHALFFRRALRGVLASFVGLLLAVTLRFAMEASWTEVSILLAIAAFVALRFKIDIMWVVLAGAGVSVFVL
ncbi:MAG: chromate efflux transporter [Acidobacteriia bacterium]|nr:chromate efflux transporter [Terriglobia bacterium]